MHRTTLPLAAAALLAPLLALPAPAADASLLCSKLDVCGRFHLTAGSQTYVTVSCDDDISVRVYPGYRSPVWCDATGYTVPATATGWVMRQRHVGHDGFVTWPKLAVGQHGISDGHEPYVSKHKQP